MKNDSTLKKTSYNFIFGLVGQIVTIGVGIIIPRLFIISYGSEINGFINSINQVFAYVALLEAGVGAATLQALYTPTGQGEREKINSILAATNYFYKRTGYLYLATICVLAFCYPLLINSNLNYWLMVIIIMINGGSGVLTYFFQGKYRIFLQAEGKNYVISNLVTINQILLSFGKATLLFFGFNVIIVQSLYLVLNGLQCMAMFFYIKRNYAWVDLKCKPDFKSISQRNSVLIHQISSLIFNNTDILLLTFFCDLKMVSVYTLYKNFLAMISTLLNNVFYSVNYRFGQIFHKRERFMLWHDIYETFHVALTFALFTTAYVHFIPFLRLYTQGMDADYLLTYMPILMISAETLNCLRVPSQNIITYAGHFKQTQSRAVVEMIINLVGSIVGVKICGIYGVILGTIVALLYRGNDIILYTNHKILNRRSLKVYRLILVNFIFAVLMVQIYEKLKLNLETYFEVLLSAAVLCVVGVVIQISVSYLVNRKEGKQLLNFIQEKLSKK